MILRVTSAGGSSRPCPANAAASARWIVAPLSTSVPSQSKIASLFIAAKLADGVHDIRAAGPQLPSNGRRAVGIPLVLVELSSPAQARRPNLEADHGANHRFEAAGLHF